MDRILDRVWIGDWHDGASTQIRKQCYINAVLNLAKELPIITWETEIYKKVDIVDGTPIPKEILKECLDFIHEHVRKKERILIHCAAGVSRSVAILMAYMYECGWNLDEALLYIRSKRPVANPNPILLESIMEYYEIDIMKELEVLRNVK